MALLLGHVVLETLYKGINWSEVSDIPRSHGSALYILLEGSLSLVTGLSVFEMYYPSMGKMLKSKEASQYVILLCVQLLIWFLY